jgi:hypothetical protein
MLTAMILAVACSGDCTAQKQFDQMEKALIASPVTGKTHCHAEGSVKAEVDATITFTAQTVVEFKGNVMGQDVDKTWDHATTPELRDSLLLGITRLGLFHNLVNFTRDRPPANVEGHIREALIPHDFALQKGNVVAYKLRAGNREMGEATITIDPKTHFPLARTLVAHLDKGDMRVTETYHLTRIK